MNTLVDYLRAKLATVEQECEAAVRVRDKEFLHGQWHAYKDAIEYAAGQAVDTSADQCLGRACVPFHPVTV